MKWPFVSRGRFEDLEHRLVAVEAERKYYLEIVLGRKTSDPARPISASAVSSDLEPVPQGQPAAYSTPFDRLESRFARAFTPGTIPAQYKARVH
jgi:hypothetical protein